MSRSTELAAPVAAAVVVLTAVLGGGFFPLPRMVVGCALIAVWVVGAMGACGRLDRTEWLFAGLLAWGLFSAIWVGSSPLAAKETLAVWIIAFALFGICRRGSADSRHRAVAVLTVGAAVIAAGVVAEALRAGLRVGGFLENPNIAAGLLVPTLPVGWRVLEGAPRWRWTWISLVAAGVVCTGSRAGLLATIVTVGVLLPRGRIRLTGLLSASAVATLVLVWRFVSEPDVLAWHRISIWWAVIKIWMTRPLTGVGPGSLVEAAGPERILHPDQLGRYQFVINYAESTPLAILVQVGAIGFILAVLAVGAWMITVRRSGAFESPSLVASLAGIAVLGLFHDFLTIDPVLWWWAALAGCSSDDTESVEVSHPTYQLSVMRCSAALVLIWMTLWGIVGPALARWIWHNGRPTTEQVVQTLRIEPWLSAAPAGRVGHLIADPAVWTWARAAEAVHWGRVAADVRPGAARVWADLGRVHLRVLTDLGGTDHDEVEARRSLRRACELDPHLPWHWLELARLERVLGNRDAAIDLAKRALESEPATVRGWVMLTRLFLENGELDKARSAMTEVEGFVEKSKHREYNEYERELLWVTDDTLEGLRSVLK